MSTRRRRLVPYAFLLPAVAIYGVFLLYPLGQVVVMSFWRWNGLTTEYAWVGLANYRRLLSDVEVWQAAANNGRWVLLAIVPIVLGLTLAVLLHQARPAGGRFYRAVLFLPYVVPTVASALVWSWLYHPTWGTINALLRGVGLDSAQRAWLGDPRLALTALAMAANWTGYGFCMMLFLAGLANIDQSLYEAARIDGAGRWRQLRHVTLPGLANTTNLVVLVVFINTVRVFDFVYVMTAGGPAGATEVLGTKIFRETFQNLDIGYGSAISVFTSLVVLAASLVYLGVRERSS